MTKYNKLTELYERIKQILTDSESHQEQFRTQEAKLTSHIKAIKTYSSARIEEINARNLEEINTIQLQNLEEIKAMRAQNLEENETLCKELKKHSLLINILSEETKNSKHI